MKNEIINISVARSNSDRMFAYEFIKNKYAKVFNTTPKASEIYLVARNDSKNIIGTIALDFEQSLIKGIYQIGKTDQEIKSLFHKSIEIGRWFSNNNYHVGLLLLYCASMYAINKDRHYGFFVVQGKILSYVDKINIPIYIIKDYSVNSNVIPDGDRNYYATSPIPCIVDFNGVQAALENKIKSLVKKNKIVFDRSLSDL